jgi:hypothetical protein
LKKSRKSSKNQTISQFNGPQKKSIYSKKKETIEPNKKKEQDINEKKKNLLRYFL